jgi:hypothetical protein
MLHENVLHRLPARVLVAAGCAERHDQAATAGNNMLQRFDI